MIFLATLPDWMLRLIGARPAAGSEVWFGFEGMDPGWALLLGGVIALLVVRSYWTGPGKLSPFQRVGLAVLRSLFLVLLLVILTHPVIRLTEETQSRGSLLVLQDVSASMELRDTRRTEADRDRVRIAYGSASAAEENPEPSRRELVEAVASNETLNLWPRVSEKADLLLVPFGREAGELRRPGGKTERRLGLEEAERAFAELDYGAPATAVAESLAGALERSAGQPLTGVLLISDGVNNAGAPLPTAVERLRERGLPLFVYAPGVEAQRDLSVISFSGPAMAFAEEDAVLSVRLRATGLTGEKSEIRLVDGLETVDAQTVTFEGDGEIELSFNYIPDEAGEFPLQVVAEELEGEATLANNEAGLQLRVLDRRVKVLLIEQEPRWDFRYLLDTLKRDRRVEVSAVMLDGDETLGQDPDSGFLAALPTPQELLDYVIVVVGDVDPRRLSPEHMEALDQLARDTGGGLVFHAGPDFNPFSYGGTALESLLPVRVAAALSNQKARYREPVSLLLTRAGRRSPLLRLDPNTTESESIWRSFPGVRWTAQTGPAKPAAEVLLVDPTEVKQAGGEPQPVLVRMSVGRGQVFYFGFDETWRWRSRVGEKHYLKIWGQVFLKLGVERLTGASDLVQLNTVRSSYALGETVLVSGRIFDQDFQPLDVPEVSGTLTIEPPADAEADPIVQDIVLKSRPERPGDYEVELLGATPGRYVVRTDRDPEATVVFDVSASNLEMRDPAVNLAGLKQLVGAEGRVFHEEDLDELPEAVAASLPTTRDVRKYEPAFHPFLYCLLLLLPAAEWTIRRILKLK